MLSPSDTALVFLLALLLFGPEQLPRIARQLGEAMRHMQSTTQTFMNEMDRAARASERVPPPPPAHEDIRQPERVENGETAEAVENGSGETPPERTT
jgi:TatA/E family protein of Tat protein translocase